MTKDGIIPEDLARMVPHEEVAFSRFCLADPGPAYVVYLLAGGTVSVDLSAAAGVLAGEWLHPSASTSQPAADVRGGAKRPLKAAFAGDVALYPHTK
jgi:hypothetical protein